MIEVLKRIQSINKQTEETLKDAFSVVLSLEDRSEIKKWSGWIRSEAMKIPNGTMYELIYRTYVFEAQKGDFDEPISEDDIKIVKECVMATLK